MRTNGLLRIETRQGGGVNEWGEHLGDAVSWGEPVPCLISTNADTRLGRYEDGEFRQSSYTVLVEGDGISAERIRLERCGEDLGEFRVISLRPIATAGRMQIIV